MTHICTICHKELPDSEFYPTSLKHSLYQCKKCANAKHKKYMREVKELEDKDFDRYYGGYVIAILNHARPKEYKYTIKGTNGYMIQTNDSDYFRKKFDEVVTK